jgi:uncharacterized protein YcfL
MTMRKLLIVSVLLVTCSCQQKVAVPTAEELIANRQLLAEWQAKCGTGDYSRLAPAQKADLCSTTDAAATSVAQMEAGKKESDFFKANTLRK